MNNNTANWFRKYQAIFYIVGALVAIGIGYQTIRGECATNTKDIKTEVAARVNLEDDYESFERDVSKDIQEIKVEQTRTRVDVEYIKQGQQRQERLLEKIDEKLTN